MYGSQQAELRRCIIRAKAYTKACRCCAQTHGWHFEAKMKLKVDKNTEFFSDGRTLQEIQDRCERRRVLAFVIDGRNKSYEHLLRPTRNDLVPMRHPLPGDGTWFYDTSQVRIMCHSNV